MCIRDRPTIEALLTWKTSPVTGIFLSERATITTVLLIILPSQIDCSISAQTLSGKPVASKYSLAPRPPVISNTLSAKFSLRGLMIWSAPINYLILLLVQKVQIELH